MMDAILNADVDNRIGTIARLQLRNILIVYYFLYISH